MVLALRLCDSDLREPLDHPTTDIAWEEEAHRVAVVWVQQLPVHHERQHHGAGWIHAGLAGVRGAISGVTLRNLAFRALKIDPVGALLLGLDANVLEEDC